jgi:hypothetical protein
MIPAALDAAAAGLDRAQAHAIEGEVTVEGNGAGAVQIRGRTMIGMVITTCHRSPQTAAR